MLLRLFETSIFHSVATTQIPAIPAGATASVLVDGFSPFLETIVQRFSPNPADRLSTRNTLIDGLTASLAITGRESTFPIAVNETATARGELASQAQKIGEFLVGLAKRNFRNDRGDGTSISVRSPCEGHVWTRSAAGLLMGKTGDRGSMELYNEWLHRMILLRDSLLPFENYEDVPLNIRPEDRFAAIRSIEPLRQKFIADTLTGRVSAKAMTDLSKSFTSPKLSGGYGFQFDSGIIMPAVLFGSPSRFLLRYEAIHIEESKEDIVFDYALEDYYSADKAELQKADAAQIALGSTEKRSTSPVLGPLIVSKGRSKESRHLSMSMDFGQDTCHAVDVGQGLRGCRYAQLLPTNKAAMLDGLTRRQAIHRTSEFVLCQKGLVDRSRGDDQEAVWAVEAQDDVGRFALLAKLYPENIMVVLGQAETEKPVEDVYQTLEQARAAVVLL